MGHTRKPSTTLDEIRPESPLLQQKIPLMATVPHVPGAPLPELMTLTELCAFLKVKRSYIYSLTSTDRIPYRKFAGTLRFVKAEILQWIDRGRRGPRMAGPTRSDG